MPPKPILFLTEEEGLIERHASGISIQRNEMKTANFALM